MLAEGVEPPPQVEIRGRRKDGSTVWLLAQLRTIPWSGGTAVQTSVVDITLRKAYEDRLRLQANYDSLTGTPNRTLALDRLGAAIRSARRWSRSIGVLFIDVDHFKRINDTLGHAAGDRFLREASQRIRSVVRDEDTIARMGGDEFILVLPAAASHDDLRTVATKINDALAKLP